MKITTVSKFKPSYQFILINGDPTNQSTINQFNATKTKLISRIRTLGINPDSEVSIVEKIENLTNSERTPSASVYFGTLKQNDISTRLADKIHTMGIYILPVVPILSKTIKYLPSCLLGINAIEVKNVNGDIELVVSRLLEEVRLTRTRRHVFISYKRDESSGLAQQLYRSLDERSFEVFLDTHSIPRGVEFQPMLWDRMGDTDLIIFLDTPKALNSTFVEQEITRAHELGIGILQVIWPGHKRTPGTEICEVEYLEASDFLNNRPHMNARLKIRVIARIIAKAERLRACSYASRRNRIAGELRKTAEVSKVDTTALFNGPILLKRPRRPPILAIPIVGHPDSNTIHDFFSQLSKDPQTKNVKKILIYDPLGMWKLKSFHLSWLNKFLPLKTGSIDKIFKMLGISL